jgi:hypothetical protein
MDFHRKALRALNRPEAARTVMVPEPLPNSAAGTEHRQAAYIVDEGALSFVTVIYFPIWILHPNEKAEE